MAKRKRRRRVRKESIIILLVASLLIVGVISFFVYQNIQKRREQEETPVKSSLVKNDYDWSNLKSDGSLMSYEDDTYTSMQGIDVSAHQEYIDWKKVKDAGIEFAYIRVGYRGYETGIIHKDDYFDYNIQSAIDNGIKVGVYFFSQAINVEEAREEAEFTLEQIKGFTIDLPISYDIEEAGGGSGRVDDLSKEVWTQNAVTFLHIIQNAGYEAMNYNSTDLFDQLFFNEYLQEFNTWVAHYNVEYPTYAYQFLIWQYSCTGTVDGIDGSNTDMDIMFVPKDQISS